MSALNSKIKIAKIFSLIKISVFHQSMIGGYGVENRWSEQIAPSEASMQIGRNRLHIPLIAGLCRQSVTGGGRFAIDTRKSREKGKILKPRVLYSIDSL